MHDMEYVRSLALTISAVVAATLALSGGAAALWKMRTIPSDIADDVRGWVEQRVDERRARVARERKIAELVDLLPAIAEHFKPNGGSSMWDRVEHNSTLAQRGVDIAQETQQSVDRLTEDFEFHRQNVHNEFATARRLTTDVVTAGVNEHERQRHRRRIIARRAAT